jgi:glutamate formiminotransferase
MAVMLCIPNVSEGRRPDVVSALDASLRDTSGVHVLDASADADHHRSVFTLAGDGEALHQAILALFAAAIARIDLRVHAGAHPRLGAVDVVPFVPIGGTTMAECVAVARRTAIEVANRFGVPIYLYEEAAVVPNRRRLEVIRHGGFESLATRMQQPAWTPDAGPSHPHPTAGASVIGARRPLVAFNVDLASPDLRIAKAIASAVRERDGGLPFVKALGLSLPGRGVVQVSMNLTNIEVTPLPVAFDAVRREAARHGVEVLESELIGMLPRAALAGASLASVGLATLDTRRVLETRLTELGLLPAEQPPRQS